MKLKAILCIAITLSLSACAHRSDITESKTTDAVSDTISDDTQNAIDSAKELTQADQKNEPKLDNSATQVSDLLTRIRNGFRFPELESTFISEQERWNAEHPTYLTNLFTRATPFLFYIVEQIEQRDLPMELALLPAIESSFKPNAISRSSAGGLWQFIPSTGRAYGLRQDWWYDGRRDALASTEAALDYLSRLNKRFEGDWFLTLAAYNAGQGTVSRAITKNKKRGKGTKYQDLKLRLETRRYVPKLIALKNVLNNPSRFGVKLPIISNKPHFEVLQLNGQINLHQFAKDAGIDRQTLNHLNAGFKRWATSPDGPHRLLIPINSNGNVAHAESALKQATAINYKHHRIRQGDSLSQIARTYGVSVNALRTSNNLKGSNIRAGKNLLIPILGSAPVQGGLNSNSTSNTPKNHTVKKGDTLWSISKRYNVALSKLLAWNKLSKDHILSLNQRIKIYQ